MTHGTRPPRRPHLTRRQFSLFAGAALGTAALAVPRIEIGRAHV